jgi:signal transduction histidine kinase
MWQWNEVIYHAEKETIMNELRYKSPDVPENTVSAQLNQESQILLHQIIRYSDVLAEQAKKKELTGLASDLQKIQFAGQQLFTLLNKNMPAQQGESGQETAAPRNLPDKFTWGRLLVVDDVEANRKVLAYRLEPQGYSVTMAKSGREAMELVREEPFDLILLDIMMPEMDGYSVLRQLKADEKLRHIPVIVISALTELDNAVRCIEMGAEDYLTKPFNPILLKARIGACLDKKLARDREIHLFEQLQQNYNQLHELEKLRDDLTHMIIHDMRTPLSSVMMGMQTLEVVGEMNEQQQEIMGIALHGGETLLGMINDLLDIEKMESGSWQLDHAPLDTAASITSAINQVDSLLKEKKLILIRQITTDLLTICGDESKLRRILVNLLGNAIKFTPSGGTITIGAQLDEAQQSIRFFVKDTGEGIPTEYKKRIFEKFGQVQSRQSQRHPSTGLGLTFCKLAVEAHGGHIGVESELGKGSTFYFTIPLEPAATDQT